MKRILRAGFFLSGKMLANDLTHGQMCREKEGGRKSVPKKRVQKKSVRKKKR